jgi:hypothetical protein
VVCVVAAVTCVGERHDNEESTDSTVAEEQVPPVSLKFDKRQSF